MDGWSLALEVLYVIIIIGVGIMVIMKTDSPSKASAYLLLIVMFPIVGAVVYIFFGRDFRKRETYRKKCTMGSEYSQYYEELLGKNLEQFESKFKGAIGGFVNVAKVVYSDMSTVPTSDNDVRIYVNGENKFPDLLEDLKHAEHHIHIEYYIFANDEIGNSIGDILRQKAQQGVKVRLIYDDYGSRGIKGSWVNNFKDSGAEAYPFYKVIFTKLANRINYRNHRKIAIIDGKIAYVGGINVSDEYINKSENTEKLFWRDTHLRIEGTGAWSLQRIFINDWNFCANQSIRPSRDLFPEVDSRDPESDEQDAWVQIISSGPDSPYPSILFSYLQAIGLAEDYVWLTTPYFTPDESFIYALKKAVLRGVDVRMIVPQQSDSFITNTVSQSYYLDLLESGIRLFRYQKGFIHAKSMVCDDCFCTVGTANIDNRSFELNFEVNALMYNTPLAQKLKEIYLQDLEFCKELSIEAWRNRPVYQVFLEKTLRLTSPLL